MYLAHLFTESVVSIKTTESTHLFDSIADLIDIMYYEYDDSIEDIDTLRAFLLANNYTLTVHTISDELDINEIN